MTTKIINQNANILNIIFPRFDEDKITENNKEKYILNKNQRVAFSKFRHAFFFKLRMMKLQEFDRTWFMVENSDLDKIVQFLQECSQLILEILNSNKKLKELYNYNNFNSESFYMLLKFVCK